MPFWNGQDTLTAKLLGGWQISGSRPWQPTGESGNIGNGSTDYAGIGRLTAASTLLEIVGEFWVQHGRPAIPRSLPAQWSTGIAQYFNTTNGATAIWTAPPTGTFNLQKGVRDNIYSPVFREDWNLALIKTFRIYKANALEFRAEAYDVPNHANWAVASFTATSASLER